jgi:hypothetical protein
VASATAGDDFNLISRLPHARHDFICRHGPSLSCLPNSTTKRNGARKGGSRYLLRVHGTYIIDIYSVFWVQLHANNDLAPASRRGDRQRLRRSNRAGVGATIRDKGLNSEVFCRRVSRIYRPIRHTRLGCRLLRCGSIPRRRWSWSLSQSVADGSPAVGAWAWACLYRSCCGPRTYAASFFPICHGVWHDGVQVTPESWRTPRGDRRRARSPITASSAEPGSYEGVTG